MRVAFSREMRWFSLVVVSLTGLLTAGAARAVNPCNTPDPGLGLYQKWRKVGDGRVLIPEAQAVRPDGGFDLVVHFHGAEPTRKEVVQAQTRIVHVGVDLGVGSAVYGAAFRPPTAFVDLLQRTRAAVRTSSGIGRAYIRRIGLSAWSAGYGAIREVLQQPIAKNVDAVLLLDSLYGSYAASGGLKEEQLKPFLDFATDASRGRRFFFHSHSAIETRGYASTGEVARYLREKLGLSSRTVRGTTRLGLEIDRQTDRGGFHQRSYRGRDEAAHCGHLGLYRELVQHLASRWGPR